MSLLSLFGGDVGGSLARWVARSAFDPRRLLNGRSVQVRVAESLDFKLSFDADQLATRMVRNSSVFEPWLTRFFVENVRPGQVAVDVGANVGYFTILLAELVGRNGLVLAVEPVFGGSLQRNLALNTSLMTRLAQIRVCDVAASDSEETVPIFVPVRHDFASASMREPGGLTRRILAESRTLDSLCCDLASVDWIKMDVEGAEHRALLGAHATLERFHPNLVLAWSPIAFREMGTAEEEVFNFLKQLGYRLFGSSADMQPLALPTSDAWEHTVVASVEPSTLTVRPWKSTKAWLDGR